MKAIFTFLALIIAVCLLLPFIGFAAVILFWFGTDNQQDQET